MRKKLRKKKIKIIPIILLLAVLIVIIFEVTVLLSKEDDKLKKLNYSDEVIKEMIELKIDNYVIEKNIYSKTLEVAISSNQFVSDNINYYYEFEYKNDENFINYLNQLIKLKYNVKEITEIFDTLDSNQISILLNHDYVSNISDYLQYTYFNVNYIDRYIAYKNKTNYDIEKCITYVNIGLDKSYYTDTKTVTDYNSTLVLVNKYYALPTDYVPDNLVNLGKSYSLTTVKLVSEAAKKFEELSSDASNLNLSILGSSGYRSYDYQYKIYNNYKKNDPKKVDTYSARPGFSEHQTGLALDVATKTTVYTKFGTTKEYTWLKDNAHKYGFIIRYQANTVDITGYKCEEWHIRYVGIDVATYIYEHNITFDEYYIRFIEK